MADTDRDILIEVKTKVNEIHREMTHSDGRVPKLERRVELHASQINYWKGAVAIVGLLVVVFGSIVVSHVWGIKP